ncbi:MAG TPA: hypothetical protein VNP98_12930 [Chthoniobacterales bacterium]|nr:hypothetical protein [Chthoniobacterales bacterium]
MASKQEANLDLLIHDYRNEEMAEAARMLHAVVAADSWRGFSDVLRHLLHGARPLAPGKAGSNEGLVQGLDNLLGFFALLEIAALANVVPLRLREDIVADIEQMLRQPVLQRFYLKRYPQPLLMGLLTRSRYRLQGRNTPLAPKFYAFLELKDLIDEDLTIETFVWLSAGGNVDGWSVREILEVLNEPRNCIRYMLEAAEDENPRGKALFGFFALMSFCDMMDDFLSGCESDSVFQSACWHYFNTRVFAPHLGLFATLSRGAQIMSNWKREPIPEDLHPAALGSHTRFLNSAKRLFSDDYSTAYKVFCARNAKVEAVKIRPHIPV